MLKRYAECGRGQQSIAHVNIDVQNCLHGAERSRDKVEG